jgi:hypothetical protein
VCGKSLAAKGSRIGRKGAQTRYQQTLTVDGNWFHSRCLGNGALICHSETSARSFVAILVFLFILHVLSEKKKRYGRKLSERELQNMNMDLDGEEAEQLAGRCGGRGWCFG